MRSATSRCASAALVATLTKSVGLPHEPRHLLRLSRQFPTQISVEPLIANSGIVDHQSRGPILRCVRSHANPRSAPHRAHRGWRYFSREGTDRPACTKSVDSRGGEGRFRAGDATTGCSTSISGDSISPSTSISRHSISLSRGLSRASTGRASTKHRGTNGAGAPGSTARAACWELGRTVLAITRSTRVLDNRTGGRQQSVTP
jgi:hypothetical protein